MDFVKGEVAPDAIVGILENGLKIEYANPVAAVIASFAAAFHIDENQEKLNWWEHCRDTAVDNKSTNYVKVDTAYYEYDMNYWTERKYYETSWGNDPYYNEELYGADYCPGYWKIVDVLGA
jgi:hypothetical protein